jgi:hypothetical protein
MNLNNWIKDYYYKILKKNLKDSNFDFLVNTNKKYKKIIYKNIECLLIADILIVIMLLFSYDLKFN